MSKTIGAKISKLSTSDLISSTAKILRGDYKQSEYGKIILPFIILRWLECVIEPTYSVWEKDRENLNHSFFNTSSLNLLKMLSDPNNIADNLKSYINAFSPNARDIFDKYEFSSQIEKLDKKNLLHLTVEKFVDFDLNPQKVSNHEMGLLFEEFIRKFAEQSDGSAGEHFTPRDIVRLTTALLFALDNDVLTKRSVRRTLYDPTAGTGGFLSSGSEYIDEINPKAKLITFGQELNPESYAICKADMMIKGQNVENIKYGNTLSSDQLPNMKFNYMLSNPPFGLNWKKVQKQLVDEHKNQGYRGRFGAGLPKVSDGSLLFLLHLISKMLPKEDGGSRIGIILNSSPLFAGGAGSGESEIRRFVLESDLLESIIAMPTDMFFNTGIATYIWILSNNKKENRKGKVQLINATSFGKSMRKTLGSKRKELSEESIEEIVRIYKGINTNLSKIFNNTDFGYRRIAIDRPMQLSFYPKDRERLEALKADKSFIKLGEVGEEILISLDKMEHQIDDREIFVETLNIKLTALKLKLLQKHLAQHNDQAKFCRDKKGNLEPNPNLRDHENVPLSEDIHSYFEREVKPYLPLAWIDKKRRDRRDREVGIVGYEIPFNRYFYNYTPYQSLKSIDADLDIISKEIVKLLHEI
jgi:type I restriction enzyme M protein